MKVKNIISILFLITLFLQIACDDNDLSLATSISLSEQNMELDQGKSKLLVATVDVENATLFWTSSNPSIASVDQKGLVTAITGGTCVINCRVMNGIDVLTECQVTVKKTGEHAWVDLGLPSGTLWATCNVGANKPEEFGNYFAWGETVQKTSYTEDNYKFFYKESYTYKINKYCTSSNNGNVDYKTELYPEDDAATANWGSEWQMPTRLQFEELMDYLYTTKTFLESNGVRGVLIVSKINGAQIFLPYAGYYSYTYNNDVSGTYASGYYWTRSLDTTYSSDRYAAVMRNTYYDYESRWYGCSVRPVRAKGK